MSISRLKKRDNGKARIQQNKQKKWWFIGREFSNTEFEALAHVNLTAQRIIHSDTGRHIRGRDMIWGDGYRTLYSELEKDISMNSNAFFCLTPAVTQSGQGHVCSPCDRKRWSRWGWQGPERVSPGHAHTKAAFSSGVGSLSNLHHQAFPSLSFSHPGKNKHVFTL